MKIEEFEKIIKTIKDDQTAIYKKAEELYANKVYDLAKYEAIGAYEKGLTYWRDNHILEKVTISSDCISEFILNELIEYLEEFKKDHEKSNEIGKSEIYEDEDIGDCYINFIGFKYIYYKLSQNKLESEIGRLTREKVKEILKPKSVKNSVMPDCKIVKLFRDGSIDWKTLQTITYKECDL